MMEVGIEQELASSSSQTSAGVKVEWPRRSVNARAMAAGLRASVEISRMSVIRSMNRQCQGPRQ